jgi:hypothetical protein
LLKVRPTRQMLAVANSKATCEWNYLTRSQGPRDPKRTLDIYSWNNRTLKFDLLTSLEGLCQVAPRGKKNN